MIRYIDFVSAKQLIASGDINAAKKVLQNLLELNPEHHSIELELAKIYIKAQSTFDQGKELLKKLTKTSVSSEALLELGKIEMKNYNYEKAKSYFIKIMRREYHTYATLNMAKLEAICGNMDKATFYFDIVFNNFDNLTEKEQEGTLLEFGIFCRNNRKDEEAKKYVEQVYEKSKNIYALKELGLLEAKQGNIDEAICYIERLLSTKLNIDAMLQLLFLQIRKKDYEQAYGYYNDLITNFTDNVNYIVGYGKLHVIGFYLKRMLHILEEKEITATHSYLEQQIFSYSEKKAMEHIQLHLDENGQKKLHSVYDPSIQLDNLLSSVKKQLSTIHPNSIFDITDIYIIEYDKCIGIRQGIKTNLLKVVTLPNTYDIITMYPTQNKQKRWQENEERVEKVLKKESQIDKFNRRYKKY